MATPFASQGDLEEKQVTFEEIAPGAYAYTTEGDPNSGVVVGDESVLVIEAQATPRMASDVVARIREVTDKPIEHLVLTHYHAVRVLGASAYGAREVIMSAKAREMVVERGEQDWQSEFERFPRLFRGHESIPGLTWPTLTFDTAMTLWLGEREVRIVHVGEGHTRGDAVVWLPEERVLFAGDQVEYGATPYCGDAQLARWPETLRRLEALEPEALVPGRGDALTSPETCREAISGTREYVTMLFEEAQKAAAKGEDLKACYDRIHAAMSPRFGDWVIFEHCMPFNVARAYDEAQGTEHPQIWTAERDREMWEALQG